MQDVSVPLDLSFPGHLGARRSVPTSVVARLRGPENLCGGPISLRLSFPLDLADGRTRTVAGPARPGGLRGVPSGIEVVFVEPDRLALAFEIAPARGRCPWFARSRVGPPEGYAFYGRRPPRHQADRGAPPSDLQVVERCAPTPSPSTAAPPPFVARRRRPRQPRGAPARARAGGGPGRGRPRSRPEGTFEVPITLAGAPPGPPCSPNTVRALIAGPPALLETLEPAQVRAVADVAGLAPGGPVRDFPCASSSWRSRPPISAASRSSRSRSVERPGAGALGVGRQRGSRDEATVRHGRDPRRWPASRRSTRLPCDGSAPRWARCWRSASGRPCRVVLGRDTRESGPWLRERGGRPGGRAGAAAIDAGVISTPGLAFVRRRAGGSTPG